MPLNLVSMIGSDPEVNSNMEPTEYLSLFCTTKQQADLIEQITRGQTENDAWKDGQKGRLTASLFGQVCKKHQSTNSDRLTAQIMGCTTIPNV